MRLNQETASQLEASHGGPSSVCCSLLLLSHSLIPSGSTEFPPLSPIITILSATNLPSSSCLWLRIAPPDRGLSPLFFFSLLASRLLHRRPRLLAALHRKKKPFLEVSILAVGVRVPFVGSISAVVPWLCLLPRATRRIYLYYLPDLSVPPPPSLHLPLRILDTVRVYLSSPFCSSLPARRSTLV
ncbi:hypothetical protein CCMA1212_004221 [Trichoderma ghanense]|uniref:Uncharacterized protein n=1 Tax=Trichoderma ghanense TaxID=65468 RepID=A0ABY2H6E0_9HYPO